MNEPSGEELHQLTYPHTVQMAEETIRFYAEQLDTPLGEACREWVQAREATRPGAEDRLDGDDRKLIAAALEHLASTTPPHTLAAVRTTDGAVFYGSGTADGLDAAEAIDMALRSARLEGSAAPEAAVVLHQLADGTVTVISAGVIGLASLYAANPGCVSLHPAGSSVVATPVAELSGRG